MTLIPISPPSEAPYPKIAIQRADAPVAHASLLSSAGDWVIKPDHNGGFDQSDHFR
jgi:hypothetical protein